MDATLLEQLLYEEESTTLDFKKEQYLFAKASDEDKSELLKDILGFANAWRRADAYILIGVEEVRGGRSNVIGITDQLDDHSLQQFVNSKTSRPVQFSYQACPLDGKQIGIIRIDQQIRPVYLKKDYGKLERDKVYMRRGSSTNPAKPASIDEIAQMGLSTIPEQAELSVEFAATDKQESLGDKLHLQTEYCEMPPMEDIPNYGASGSRFAMASAIQYNSRYWEELAEYEFARRFLRPVRVVVHNLGRVAAGDVRVEFNIPVADGTVIWDESSLPSIPRQDNVFLTGRSLPSIQPVLRYPGKVSISTDAQEYLVEIDCGDLQPGRKVWCDQFFVGRASSGAVPFNARVYAENAERPKEVLLTLNFTVAESTMSVDDLLSISHPNEDDPE